MFCNCQYKLIYKGEGEYSEKRKETIYMDIKVYKCKKCGNLKVIPQKPELVTEKALLMWDK
jgi:RNase P subunit RPR2